jgi:hypothetical protein
VDCQGALLFERGELFLSTVKLNMCNCVMYLNHGNAVQAKVNIDFCQACVGCMLPMSTVCCKRGFGLMNCCKNKLQLTC